ncbi:MAG: nuclear transport factor 2 family protein [Devosia sp.]|jgi:hypothetical protein|uniref:nuclear transport factor 2 family protein n=1 Tax=unclassified Devosia TaxID=196773 RepID=UPI001A0079EF|nr:MULTISPECIES: nuclear transport factor 2 family protein [unclassified Devosia]MBF0678579.1 nuclear transport factor 2 family protein [Devosia sp.]WEJ31851.1 DUF4440 domain-containing protein [Devosia sp. SD17-2]
MDAAWTIERRLWLEGAAAYEDHLAEECLMAFGPMGIMNRRDIIESLAGGPRWTRVEISDQRFAVPEDSAVVVLAYRAEAQRDDAPPYRALCTSTYLITGGNLKLIQHQQTPL